MCGFLFSRTDTPLKDLDRLQTLMHHRGPDDRGVLVLEEGNAVATLLHNRLSIIDLSSKAHQPMSSADDRYAMVYNGEIYNYLELREELEYPFQSHSDTEVILAGFIQWGLEGLLARLNGMFAFVIWDRKERKAYGARDHLGIKPFYYFKNGATFVCASEMKAILATGLSNKSLNAGALLSILRFLWIPDPESIFSDIHKLPPGHCFVYEGDRLDVKPYWSLKYQEPLKGPEEELIEQLRALLKNAVKRQMIADVPVGAFLSGGLDSSLITALMRQNTQKPVTTFTIAFSEEDQKFEKMAPDWEYARKVAAALGCDHHEIPLKAEIVDLLPKILWHLEEPIADPAAINTYLISKAARELGIKVLLNGMGGDEVFGGYRKHLSAVLGARYRLIPGFIRRGLMEPLVNALPVAGKRSGFKYLRWLKRFMKSASLDSFHCFVGNYGYYNEEELTDLVHPDLLRGDGKNYAMNIHIKHWESSRDWDYINRMCYLDCQMFLPALNLAYSDRASMAASVETRPPLIDKDIVEWAFRIPGSLKIRRMRQKYILKEAARGWIDDEIINRPKAPFGAPLRAWMRTGLKSMMSDLLSRDSIRKRGFFRPEAIENMIDKNDRGVEDYGHRLWALLTLELWMRENIG